VATVAPRLLLSLPPLSLPRVVGTQGLKRKVEDAFEDAYDEGRKRMAEVAASHKAKINNTKSLFHACGTSCGGCLLLRVSNAGSHKHTVCPMLSQEERKEAGDMRIMLKYERPYNGACWICHLPSGGDDQWHPSFGNKAPCPHPNLVWTMAYTVWKRSEYRTKAEQVLNVGNRWDTVAGFLKWFVEGVKSEPNGFRLVKWVLQSELGLY
jgi:hypothetical protein